MKRRKEKKVEKKVKKSRKNSHIWVWVSILYLPNDSSDPGHEDGKGDADGDDCRVEEHDPAQTRPCHPENRK